MSWSKAVDFLNHGDWNKAQAHLISLCKKSQLETSNLEHVYNKLFFQAPAYVKIDIALVDQMESWILKKLATKHQDVDFYLEAAVKHFNLIKTDGVIILKDQFKESFEWIKDEAKYSEKCKNLYTPWLVRNKKK